MLPFQQCAIAVGFLVRCIDMQLRGESQCACSELHISTISNTTRSAELLLTYVSRQPFMNRSLNVCVFCVLSESLWESAIGPAIYVDEICDIGTWTALASQL